MGDSKKRQQLPTTSNGGPANFGFTAAEVIRA